MRPSAEAASTGSRDACDQIVDERGEEHRLAGTREAGHAQAQRRRRKSNRRSSGRRARPRTQNR